MQDNLLVRQELARYLVHSSPAGLWVCFVYGMLWALFLIFKEGIIAGGVWLLGLLLLVLVIRAWLFCQKKYFRWDHPKQVNQVMFRILLIGGIYHGISLLYFYPQLTSLGQIVSLLVILAMIPILSIALLSHRRGFNGYWSPVFLSLLICLNYHHPLQLIIFSIIVLSFIGVNFTQHYLSRVLLELFIRHADSQILVDELRQSNKLMRVRSERDELTHLNNRAVFNQLMARWWHLSSRSGIYLCLLIIDIDYFKAYNDHYGHLAGDECLKDVAQALERSLLREDDVVARFGGEEFVVLLPNTTLVNGVQVAKRIQSELSKLAKSHEYSSVSSLVTCSIGICSMVARHEKSSLLLLQKADEALYQAKRDGRNCYRMAPRSD